MDENAIAVGGDGDRAGDEEPKSPTSPTSASPLFSASRVSNAFKHFKLACVKARTAFHEVVIVEPDFSLVFQAFTANTVILVVLRGGASPAVAKHNIGVFKAQFHRALEGIEAAAEGEPQAAGAAL